MGVHTYGYQMECGIATQAKEITREGLFVMTRLRSSRTNIMEEEYTAISVTMGKNGGDFVD